MTKGKQDSPTGQSEPADSGSQSFIGGGVGVGGHSGASKGGGSSGVGSGTGAGAAPASFVPVPGGVLDGDGTNSPRRVDSRRALPPHAVMLNPQTIAQPA